jgi:cytochrome c oxidase subunit 4
MSQAVHDSPNIHKYAAPSNTPMDLSVSHGSGSAHVHVTSPILLLSVYAVLVTLTIITVAVTLVDLGQFNIWVALAVAVLKAGLVAFYFMHLRWDSPFNGIVLIISLFFVSLFIGISILDSKEYQHNYTPPGTTIVP